MSYSPSYPFIRPCTRVIPPLIASKGLPCIKLAASISPINLLQPMVTSVASFFIAYFGRFPPPVANEGLEEFATKKVVILVVTATNIAKCRCFFLQDTSMSSSLECTMV